MSRVFFMAFGRPPRAQKSFKACPGGPPLGVRLAYAEAILIPRKPPECREELAGTERWSQLPRVLYGVPDVAVLARKRLRFLGGQGQIGLNIVCAFPQNA